MEIRYPGNELQIFKNAVNWKKYFSSKLRAYIKGDVLEVGAGLGANTPFLINDGVSSWKYVEPDSKLAQNIKDNGVSKLISQSTLVGTISDLSTGYKYDTIIYIDVLEHIRYPKDEISEIYAHLKPGGHLVVLVSAFNFLFSEFDRKLGHFRRYTKTTLVDELQDRLKKVKLFYIDSLGFFASAMNKLFLHKSVLSEEDILFWDKILIPISRVVDSVLLGSFGKSLIGIYQKN